MKLKHNKLFWIAASISSLVLSSTVLALSTPYLWSQPNREINRIQESLPVQERLSAKEKAELVNRYRETLVSSIGTIATIIGGVVLIVNVYLATKRLNLDTTRIADDKKLTETRLISERFSTAIEQLGSESIHIRLGGIYSLEKIAKDSPDDHWTVMEVLTAFIRKESPRKWSEYDLPEDCDGFDPSDILTLSTIIQAAVTVIARRESHDASGKVRDRGEIYLPATYLGGANLKQAYLSNANLRVGTLTDADLRSANLRKADLSGSRIERADFQGAHLYGAALCNADLSNADLSEADLSSADLKGAKLFGVNLSGANLSNACLQEANLGNADLSGADVSGADLRDARFSRANLSGVQNLIAAKNLKDADLSNSILDGVTLINVDLSNADLLGSQLKGIDLSSANLSGAHLRGADLKDAVLKFADLHRANLKEADLTRADLTEADLSDANLWHTKLSGTNLSRTNLKDAEGCTQEQIEEGMLCQTYLPEGMTLNPDRDCEELKA